MNDADFDMTRYFDENNFDYGAPQLPSFDSRSVSPADHSRLQRSEPGLPLLRLDKWNPNLPYNESLPTCIYYSIEWKLLLKKGRLTKLTSDTEQNLVLSPGAFWNRTLKSKVEDLLKRATPRNKCYNLDETNIAICTTKRAERPLSKRFDELNICWDMIEEQLRA